MPNVVSPSRGPLGELVADTVKVISILRPGAVAATTFGTQYRWYNDTDYTLNVVAVRVNLGTAGSTTTTVDILKNSTSIFNVTPANRPSLTTGLVTALGGTPDTTTIAPGQFIDVSVTAAGTSAADMNVFLTVSA